ncbi:WD40-repeat-containing domain protein [Aspergillus avenaceus]|uniref:WD40-repeat-containing domain protein n=1 Tax=Aspergillus avenaceus TaxID=36643 RepID=A0A5N6TW20_ASPAV|nr:WD40-repeat-containing domain protein [Aspergillus avenaceus]
MNSGGSPPTTGDRPEEPSRRDSPAIWHPAREWLEEDEEDDHDIDNWPVSGSSENSDFRPGDEFDEFEGYEAQMNDFEDPELHLGNIHIEFAMDDEGGPGQPAAAGGQQGGRHSRVSAARLLNLLASNGLRHILHYNGWQGGGAMDGDEEDDDELGALFGLRRRARRGDGDPLPTVPSDEGRKLMASGDFGSNSHYLDELKKRRKSLAMRTMWRELGVDVSGNSRRDVQSISQGLIPGSVADRIIHFDSRCYSGQFSDDGNFFFSCSQDFKVRMYDTSNPYDWKYYKTVDYPFGQWTITDASLSPDNKFLAYTSIRNLVCLAPTDPQDSSEPTVLDLSSASGRPFGIWSLRFSGDGSEIVAGTSDNSVILYDVETRQSVLRMHKHVDDVNAVCFGDKSSPHILYSGSDDSTLRVWDRRSMGDGREAGVFIGHTEGLTYIDSKGDGRYVLSNGKDQNMKLWDLRKMMTTARFDNIDTRRYTSGFDYRFEPYPENYYEAHPHDCSVVTFRGHKVLKTLIRCHFSPPESTDSRYVYTGSADGKVYVYNLDATLAGTMDVGQVTADTRPQDRGPWQYHHAYEFSGDLAWQTCVRDASWHPNAPVVAATSWNGWGSSTGTCTVHSWNNGATEDEGTPPVSRNYDCQLKPKVDYDNFKEDIRRLRSRPVPRRGPLDDEYAYELW